MGSSEDTIPDGKLTDRGEIFFTVLQFPELTLVTGRVAASKRCFLREATAESAAVAATEIAATAAERIEAAFFTETVALVLAPTPPSIVTHNLLRTFVFSPPLLHSPNRAGGARRDGSDSRIESPPP